jgi:hypothetical protein
MQHFSSALLPIVLIGWMIYRRIRRTVGYQKLIRSRLKFRTGMFALLGLLILAMAFRHPIQFAGDAIGLTGGLVLGYFGIRHLKFEKREEGWFYRTHVWVEVTVLVLFLSRVAYRVVEMVQMPSAVAANAANAANANPAANFTRDPLTSAVFFVLVTYYVWFYSYLLRKGKELESDPAAA